MNRYYISQGSVSMFYVGICTVVWFAIIFCLLFDATSFGNTITLSDSATQTYSGQDFTFAFSSVGLSDGSDGVFTINARGDYSQSSLAEFLTWDIDGFVSGKASPALSGSTATVLGAFGGNDVEWIDSFTLSGELLNAITSDSQVTISIDLESPVNMGWGSNQFVDVALAYSVPEPTTIALLGLGGLVLGKKRH